MLATAALAGCGAVTAPAQDGGSAADAEVDAAVDAAPAVPDAAGCAPSPTVLAAGGADKPAGVRNLMLSSDGSISVFFANDASGESARVWDGKTWTTHAVYTGTTGNYPGFAHIELGGRPMIFETLEDKTADSGKVRSWTQLANGDFQPGGDLPGLAALPFASVTHAAVFAGKASVFADDLGPNLYLAEQTLGSWKGSPFESAGKSPATVGTAGIGTLADGTPAVVLDGSFGLFLYQRSISGWMQWRHLVTGTIPNATVVFPPDGSKGPFAIALWQDPAAQVVRGAFLNLTTTIPTDAITLFQQVTAPVGLEVAFEPGGARGKIVVTVDGRPWVSSFEGTTFTAPVELRSDLVFEAPPRLIYHPCVGYMILHVSRAPTAPPGSAPLVLEPLATFAP